MNTQTLGRVIGAARATRGSVRSGVVIEAVDSTHALVDIGDRSVICLMPTSLGVIAAGQQVRVSIDSNSYLITAILGGATAGSFWSGRLASGFTPTASNYTSCLPATFVGATGAPDFTPEWDGDCLIPPFPAWWQITWKVCWTGDSTTGNRQAAIYLNPSATTWDSSSNLSGGLYLDSSKVAPSTAETGHTAERRYWLTPADRVMCIARTTSATGILAGEHETRMTLSLIRTTP